MNNGRNGTGAGGLEHIGASDADPASAGSRQPTAAVVTDKDLRNLAEQIGQSSPQEVIDWALDLYGKDCAISFSGAEDVMLIELAARSGKPFSVFSLDTGRLHPETYEFVDRVRNHYGIEIEVFWPELVSVQNLVRDKGFFSFYRDGHQECCSIRKVEPLQRALSKYRMWVTGQRRDQSPTRSSVEIIQRDPVFAGADGPLLKLNPLATLTLTQVWSFIRAAGTPYNELHDRGFISIGCAPCTRAVRPGEHERAGRWSWEEATKRECGLHVKRPADYSI
jgi:thioredoxin-dependent adenylylsulfate APS reductase